jgi:3-phenylpropionate/cinnamic acid dioxygenase small subunit
MTNDTLDRPLDAHDRYAIEDVITAYGTAIDTRDWDLFQSIFTEDSKIDYGFGSWNSSEEFRQFMQAAHDPAGNTLHRMTNIVATRTEAGISARSYGDSIVLVSDNTTGDHGAAYYDDELILLNGRWKIASRHCTLVLFEKITGNIAASM